ncbi:MAG TPA: RDD family protein [Chitinophaga sp.]|uniref:RDD family protein n=1 Tax=Chitinophaga sp. TaxID=1869181 RepID=UPI002CEF9DAA|nr:RDD family protein [Chitinophaga sp.]HVI47959.1 RDD family protein [Chitinophaga sp.]
MELTDNFLQEEYHLVMASTGKRLANYLIDMLVFYAFIFLLFMMLAVVNPYVMALFDDESPGFKYLDRLLGLVLYGLFMGLVEGLFKGRSLGKLITGTRAVNNDGTEISFATGFKRGLSRMVPFEVFSAFGNPCHPWHDKWTQTEVVVLKESVLPENN